MSPDLPLRREANKVMQPSCLEPTIHTCIHIQYLWENCYDLGLLKLVRSRFSNVMCPKNEVGSLTEYTEWPGYSLNYFFSSLIAWAYSRMTMPGLIGLKLWNSGSGRHHFHTWIGHHRVYTLNPTENLWDVLAKTLLSGPTLPSSLKELGEKWMQLWMDTNVVTLHKRIKMMPHWMSAVIKWNDREGTHDLLY